MIKTYGDKYCALTEKFIDIQNEFIAAIQHGHRRDLSHLTGRLKRVRQELSALHAFMKEHKLGFPDAYPQEKPERVAA